MQKQKRVLLLVPVVIALRGLNAYAAVDGQASPQPAHIAATDAAAPIGGAESDLAATTAAASQDAQQPGFGVALTAEQLDQRRGGDALIGQNYLTGSVADNAATNVATGSNTIGGGSFANSSGLPTVIQNTGANVLIQNATVLNVRFGN
ncbi:MAG: hypothetical protein EPN57_18925 [Paraburkholderia sp.]|nr:MAG: hypothetical protein EPN57_18925 [Paraburkholderia sp.]